MSDKRSIRAQMDAQPRAWFRRFERQLARAKARKEAEARARARRELGEALKAILDKQETP